MTRTEAIAVLCASDVATMSPERRKTILEAWWAEEGEDTAQDPRDRRHDRLLVLACRQEYVGVVNEYLERRLGELGVRTSVTGEVEPLMACPCCQYCTLPERGGYDICPVCFWEDDGTGELDVVSGPNHITLREARESFARLGACDEAARAHVRPDGRERYRRSPC